MIRLRVQLGSGSRSRTPLRSSSIRFTRKSNSLLTHNYMWAPAMSTDFIAVGYVATHFGDILLDYCEGVWVIDVPFPTFSSLWFYAFLFFCSSIPGC